MSRIELRPTPNAPYIETWNEVLTPKWLRFRHLLSGNGQVHSDLAYPRMDIRRGQRVLDVACGFGENALELADRVGPLGTVLGIDCTHEFIEVARREAEAAGMTNLEYRADDIETAELAPAAFDAAVSRFGIMFCASPIRALRAIHGALVPGGQLGLLAWRSPAQNPCWRVAEQIAQRHVGAPGDEAESCGPGLFSLAGRDTNLRMMHAAGFEHVAIQQLDAELCVGRTLDEAVDYQVAVGPAGYAIREAGTDGQRALATIRGELRRTFARHQRPEGGVWLGSSTWFVTGRRPLETQGR